MDKHTLDIADPEGNTDDFDICPQNPLNIPDYISVPISLPFSVPFNLPP